MLSWRQATMTLFTGRNLRSSEREERIPLQLNWRILAPEDGGPGLTWTSPLMRRRRRAWTRRRRREKGGGGSAHVISGRRARHPQKTSHATEKRRVNVRVVKVGGDRPADKSAGPKPWPSFGPPRRHRHNLERRAEPASESDGIGAVFHSHEFKGMVSC